MLWGIGSLDDNNNNKSESKRQKKLTLFFRSFSLNPPNLAHFTGPVPTDVPWPPPHYEWWNAVEVEGDGNDGNGNGNEKRKRTFVYEGLEETLNHISAVLDSQGPFDGFLAFSQGTILASLLLAAWSKADEARERKEKDKEEEEEEEGGGGGGEEGRRRRRASSSWVASTSSPNSPSSSSASAASPLVLPPRLAGLSPPSRPRFAVLVSGVWAKAPICSALEREEEVGDGGDGAGKGARWTRRESSSGDVDDDGTSERQTRDTGGCIRAPSLHIIGRRDYVSPLSRRLAAAFRNSVVVEHAGGHVVPRLPPAELATLRAFLGAQAQATASCL